MPRLTMTQHTTQLNLHSKMRNPIKTVTDGYSPFRSDPQYGELATVLIPGHCYSSSYGLFRGDTIYKAHFCQWKPSKRDLI